MKTSKMIVGVDTAKRVFHLYWVDMETGEEMSLRLSRAKFLRRFANHVPCLVAMEACGGSQHWARELKALGHEVRILPAKAVRPFVRGNKNDAHDARAIWTAVQQPGVRMVAVKSEEQQAVLALHRMREQLIKFRTAQINGLRGLLAEYGEVMPKGRAGLKRDLPGALEQVSERLPAMAVDSLRDQWARVLRTDEEIATIERRLQLWHRGNEASRRVAEIPGVGLLTATAAAGRGGCSTWRRSAPSGTIRISSENTARSVSEASRRRWPSRQSCARCCCSPTPCSGGIEHGRRSRRGRSAKPGRRGRCEDGIEHLQHGYSLRPRPMRNCHKRMAGPNQRGHFCFAFTHRYSGAAVSRL